MNLTLFFTCILYTFILVFGIHKEYILCPFMTDYNENGTMIKISYFIETVLLLICSSVHAMYTENIIIHNYKY